MLAQEIIRHKRDGQKLTKEEIDFFIKGATDWSVSESQIAAFTMAVFLRGMDLEETTALTRAMTQSGEVVNWADKNLNGPVIDKHSSGGVGDSVSLILAPLLAACGVYVPMIAGRGLGHTGGTLDKIESIPGYTTIPSLEQFCAVTQQVGCAIIGQTGDLAPTDKRFYAIRDVAATVESVPLITASILSKKLSAGLQGLIIDLKCGNGAFMARKEEARNLAQIMVKVAVGSGVSARALLSNMDQVLGESVGNALEVNEAIAYLKGEKRNSRLNELTLCLCSEALMLKNIVASKQEAYEKLQQALDTGKAAECFEKMVAALGGPADILEDPFRYLPKAPIIRPVYTDKTGYVCAMNTHKIGATMITLGGQRKHLDQRLDLSVGFTNFVQIGDKLEKDCPIAFVHAANEDSFTAAQKQLQSAIEFSDEKPVETPVVYETLTA